MKTTVDIEDELLKEAKRAAVEEETTLRELIEDGLRHRLALHRANARVESWGAPGNTSRDDLYASRTWKILDDLERAHAEYQRKKANS